MSFSSLNEMLDILASRREELMHYAPFDSTPSGRENFADAILREGSPQYQVARAVCEVLLNDIKEKDAET